MTVNDLLAVYHQRYIRLHDVETGKEVTLDREQRHACARLSRDYGARAIAKIEADVDSIEGEEWTMLYIEI